MRKFFLITFIVHCVSANRLFSQTDSDSNSSKAALQNAIDLYYAVTGENAHLYIGSQSAGYDKKIIGNPFFDTIAVQNGSIYYNGTLYKSIPMLYDILNDDILINKYNQNYYIRLANEKVGYFSILKHNFIRIVPDSADKTLPGIGFYDRIYNGKTEVIVKRKKLIMDDPPISNEIVTRFVQYNSYFVKKNHAYFQVVTKSSLSKLFEGKYKEIRRYLKKSKIKFRKQPELALIKAAQYYDQLTN